MSALIGFEALDVYGGVRCCFCGGKTYRKMRAKQAGDAYVMETRQCHQCRRRFVNVRANRKDRA